MMAAPVRPFVLVPLRLFQEKCSLPSASDYIHMPVLYECRSRGGGLLQVYRPFPRLFRTRGNESATSR